MKRFLPLALLFLLLSSCNKTDTITFTAVIEQIGEGSILVNTPDDSLGFQAASVSFPEPLTLPENLSVGQMIEVEALPEIRESYPVQVTAVKITQKESSMAEYKKNQPHKKQCKGCRAMPSSWMCVPRKSMTAGIFPTPSSCQTRKSGAKPRHFYRINRRPS